MYSPAIIFRFYCYWLPCHYIVNINSFTVTFLLSVNRKPFNKVCDRICQQSDFIMYISWINMTYLRYIASSTLIGTLMCLFYMFYCDIVISHAQLKIVHWISEFLPNMVHSRSGWNHGSGARPGSRPVCFLGPAFKALPIPPNLHSRCMSWNDADQVIP